MQNGFQQPQQYQQQMAMQQPGYYQQPGYAQQGQYPAVSAIPDTADADAGPAVPDAAAAGTADPTGAVQLYRLRNRSHGRGIDQARFLTWSGLASC